MSVPRAFSELPKDAQQGALHCSRPNLFDFCQSRCFRSPVTSLQNNCTRHRRSTRPRSFRQTLRTLVARYPTWPHLVRTIGAHAEKNLQRHKSVLEPRRARRGTGSFARSRRTGRRYDSANGAMIHAKARVTHSSAARFFRRTRARHFSLHDNDAKDRDSAGIAAPARGRTRQRIHLRAERAPGFL